MAKNQINRTTSAPTSNSFCKSLYNAAVSTGVNATTAHWYVKWIKHLSQYLKRTEYLKNTQLRNLTESDVKNYLADLSLKSNITQWQVEQARDALHFLYGAC